MKVSVIIQRNQSTNTYVSTNIPNVKVWFVYLFPFYGQKLRQILVQICTGVGVLQPRFMRVKPQGATRYLV